VEYLQIALSLRMMEAMLSNSSLLLILITSIAMSIFARYFYLHDSNKKSKAAMNYKT
jgi:hypothetical protein